MPIFLSILKCTSFEAHSLQRSTPDCLPELKIDRTQVRIGISIKKENTTETQLSPIANRAIKNMLATRKSNHIIFIVIFVAEITISHLQVAHTKRLLRLL